jgi:hypothetical protein
MRWAGDVAAALSTTTPRETSRGRKLVA